MRQKVVVYSTKPYDRVFLSQANESRGHELIFLEDSLKPETAALAAEADVACVFVHDHADAASLETLAKGRTKLIALRCAGYNNLDLKAATALGLDVRRVPSYSPYAVAEFAIALIFTLNRKVHRAYNRVREGNFALEGLLGFDIHGCTVGVIGTGKIGCLMAAPMKALGCQLLGYDVSENPAFRAAGGVYTSLNELLEQSDIISLHCPRTPETTHIINRDTISQMKPGAFLVNTARGGCVDADAVLWGIESGKLRGAALDVLEVEPPTGSEPLIAAWRDPNHPAHHRVIINPHAAFYSEEGLDDMRIKGSENCRRILMGKKPRNVVN